MTEQKLKPYRATIDTMQLGIDVSDCNLEELRNIDNLYSRAINNNKKISLNDSNVNIRLKVHNLYKVNDKEHYIESFKRQKEILEDVLRSIGVNEIEKVAYKRVDIAIDTPDNFTEAYKKNDYFFDLLTYKMYGSTFFNTDKNTRKIDCIRLVGRSINLCFYDKEAESKGNAEYKTRLEFRFSRFRNRDLDGMLDKLIEFIGKIEKNIKGVEKKQIKILNEMWDNRENKNVKLSEFVRCNEEMIFTRKILQGLYEHVGLKSPIKVWIDNFRRSNKLEFISKTEIKTMKKDILREVKRYKKS